MIENPTKPRRSRRQSLPQVRGVVPSAYEHWVGKAERGSFKAAIAWKCLDPRASEMTHICNSCLFYGWYRAG
jgi:hypothetical protein